MIIRKTSLVGKKKSTCFTSVSNQWSFLSDVQHQQWTHIIQKHELIKYFLNRVPVVCLPTDHCVRRHCNSRAQAPAQVSQFIGGQARFEELVNDLIPEIICHLILVYALGGVNYLAEHSITVETGTTPSGNSCLKIEIGNLSSRSYQNIGFLRDFVGHQSEAILFQTRLRLIYPIVDPPAGSQLRFSTGYLLTGFPCGTLYDGAGFPLISEDDAKLRGWIQ